MANDLTEKQTKALNQICKAFYQAYRLSGLIHMTFGVRSTSDSDGNSVVDVYLSPQDKESAETLWDEKDNAQHMQFLESMVPAEILGYQFVLQLTSEGTNEVNVEVMNTLSPVGSISPQG